MDDTVQDSPDDYPAETYGSHDSICRSRSSTIKSRQSTPDTPKKDPAHERRKKIRKCIGYLIIGIMIAAIILIPVVVSIMRRPPVYYVTHRSTTKSVTSPTRPRTTTTTATPFDKCDRRFFALTKKLPNYISIVAGADFNNDNQTDIIFTHDNCQEFFIIFNLGFQNFADYKNYPTSATIISMIINDINQDNYPDVILGLDSFDISIQILFNKGDGTFKKAINIKPKDNFNIANSIAIADMDNDGRRDIIALDSMENTMGIFINQNNKQFKNKNLTQVDLYSKSIATGDLNNDNQTDIIVANTRTNKISIFYNNNNGQSFDLISYAVDVGPIFVTIADMNHDNDSDIVLVNYFSNNVVIYRNDGYMNFTRQTNITDMVNPLLIALTDYNSDGSLDIVVPNYHSTNIGVFLNDGHGNFSIPTNYLSYPLPRTIAIGDLNNDGKPDIIVGNGYYVGMILSRCYL